MKRPIPIMLGIALLACMEAVLARGPDHHGSGRGAVAAPRASMARPAIPSVRPVARPGWQGVRPVGRPGWQGVRPIVSVHPQPGVVIRHHHRPRHHHPHRSRFSFGSTVILGAPLFFPPPVYVAPAPVYAEPPVYIEQGSQIYYYCPDYRDYYPNVATCPSPWLQVLPEAVNPN